MSNADLTDLRQYTDETLNDSIKSWTVPDGEIWELVAVYIDYTATVSAGSRRVAVEALDAASLVRWGVYAPNTLTAGYANVRITFAPNMPYQANEPNVFMLMPLPSRPALLPGWSLKVWDLAGIDAAADDMLVRFLVRIHTV
jgi:hypothetical protein